MNESPSDGLQTTRTSLQVLEFVKETGAATLADVVSEFDLAKSTAHHHLSTLRSAGFLDKEGEVYYVGIHLFNLGEQARQRHGPADELERVVRNLAEETLEEAVLVVENGGRLITLHSVTHDRTDRSDRRTGCYHHLHDSAVGKAILASYSDEQVETTIDRWGLPPTTPQTITNYEDLLSELRQTRERGYALSDQEWLEGLSGIGKSITGPTGGVFGALGVSGPTYRFRDDTAIDQLVEALESSVSEMEAILMADVQQ